MTRVALIEIQITGVELFTGSHTRSYFGVGTGPILYAYLNCDGTETALSDCSSYRSYPFGVSHSSDVGVRCNTAAVSSKQTALANTQ